MTTSPVDECEQRLRQLFEWWKAPEAPFPFPLAPDFRLDDGTPERSLDSWVELRRITEPPNDVTLLDIVVDGEGRRGVLAFDAEDSVTGIFHRFAWLVRFEDGALKSLLATHGTLLERSAWFKAGG